MNSRIAHFFRKAFVPIRAQLVQGANPRGLAMSCAFGVIFGIFPLFGFTTLLCLIFGVLFRLNQPALQAVNYLMAPFQLVAIPFFAYWGIKLGHDKNVDLHPDIIVGSFMRDPSAFFKQYGLVGFHAVIVWAVCAPVIGFVIFEIAVRSFRRISRHEETK